MTDLKKLTLIGYRLNILYLIHGVIKNALNWIIYSYIENTDKTTQRLKKILFLN